MLYLVATPIGNLKDISLRALEVLKKCDYILAEDTRHSRILLDHYEITTPLKSYHQFNEKKREEELIVDLKKGLHIALISDAGTPAICDPGELLVKKCHVENIPVTSVPGPCAWVVALSLSSLSKEKVQFLGFLPQTEELLNRKLAEIVSFRGTSVFYEAPHRLFSTLQKIGQLDPQRILSLCKELTKTFEACLEGPCAALLEELEKKPPKGEWVVVVDGCGEVDTSLSPLDHVKHLEKAFSLSKAEAIKLAAELRGVPKREIYNLVNM